MRARGTIGWLTIVALALPAAGCSREAVVHADGGAAPEPLAAPAVAVCSAAPFLGAGEPNPSPDDAAVVGTVTEAHTELFAGAWWDAGAQEYVSTAIDATRAGSVLSVELPATLRRRVETVPRSDAQLAALQARVTELAAGGVLAGVAVPRNRLPAAPFTVTTERYRGVCEDAVVSTLGG